MPNCWASFGEPRDAKLLQGTIDAHLFSENYRKENLVMNLYKDLLLSIIESQKTVFMKKNKTK